MKENRNIHHLKKKTRFPISKIKKIILQNEEIGKTASTVPVVLSKAVELFIKEVSTNVYKSLDESDHKITLEKLEAVLNSERYSILLKK
ncbi:DPB3 [Hepatospora eriocheir]|uniref:DPB3 n=1 Tax=Hepatospora eriocheir TaxID=1081669 RepID=A0A1X0QCM5_9MICR|nr:DPB3 [Hepatospora eriocheir]ORD99593.1 DPB3 [Hepatospora eriocheir]